MPSGPEVVGSPQMLLLLLLLQLLTADTVSTVSQTFRLVWQLIFGSCQQCAHKSLKVNSISPKWHINSRACQPHCTPDISPVASLLLLLLLWHTSYCNRQLCHRMQRRLSLSSVMIATLAAPVACLVCIFHNTIHVIRAPATCSRPFCPSFGGRVQWAERVTS